MIDLDITPANYDLPHINNDTDLQNFIKTIGEKFIDTNKRRKEMHGQVYTPIEIVDFINNSIKDLLKSEFGKEPDDEDIVYEDPFCGTGIFQARLMENHNVNPENLFATDIEWYHFYLTKANLETKHYNQTGIYKEMAVRNYDTFAIDPREGKGLCDDDRPPQKKTHTPKHKVDPDQFKRFK